MTGFWRKYRFLVFAFFLCLTGSFLVYATLTHNYPQGDGQVLADTLPYNRLLLGDSAVAEADLQLGRKIDSLSTDAYTAWWAPCVIKVLPGYQAPSASFNPDQDKAVRLGRNETRCFQLALTAGASGQVPPVTINPSDASITAEASLQALINITEASYSYEKNQDNVTERYDYSHYTGQLPDPLIPWSFLPYTGDDPDGDGRSPSLDNLATLKNSKSQMVAGQTRALLVEVTTTATTPAGVHYLNVTMGGKNISLPIEVFSFTLPDRPTFKTAMGTSSFNTNLDIGRPLTMHGVSTTTEMKKLMDNYYHEALASFRMAPYTPTWPVKLVETGYDFISSDSEYNCTTDVFKLRPAAEALLNKFLGSNQIGSGYLKDKPIPPMSNWQIQHLTSTVYENPAGMSICGIKLDDETETKQPGVPNWEWALGRFYSAMHTYLTTNGKNWDRYAQINMDEPTTSRVEAIDPTGQYRDLNRPLPLAEQNAGFKNVWRISKVALDRSGLPVGAAMARLSDFYDMTDDRLARTYTDDVQVPGQYPFNNPVFINDLNQEETGRNWITKEGFAPAPRTNCDPLAPPYQTRCLKATDDPWYYHVFDPTFQGDSPALDQVMPGWMAYKYNLSGLLYWSINWWASDSDNTKTFVNPWTNPKTFTYSGLTSQNLSNVLWYPPCGEIKCPTPTYYVINSLRLPLMRESILDYEYMKILETQQNRQAVLTLTQLQGDDLIRRTTIWRYDPATVLSLRYSLAETISHSPPIITSTPTPAVTSTPTPTSTTVPTKTPTPASLSPQVANGDFQAGKSTLAIKLSSNTSPLLICNVPAISPTLPSGWSQTTTNLMTKIIANSQCLIGSIGTGWLRTGNTSYPARYDIVLESSGNQSQQVIAQNTSTGIYRSLALTSGRRYRIEADVYVQKGQVVMRLNDSVSGKNIYSNYLSAKAGWQKASMAITDGGLFTNSLLRIMSRANNTIFYVDNVKIIPI